MKFSPYAISNIILYLEVELVVIVKTYLMMMRIIYNHSYGIFSNVMKIRLLIKRRKRDLLSYFTKFEDVLFMSIKV